MSIEYEENRDWCDYCFDFVSDTCKRKHKKKLARDHLNRVRK